MRMTVEQLVSDCNWGNAFNEAFRGQFGDGEDILGAVKEVVATDEGENDTRDWIGVFEMRKCKDYPREKRFAVVRAGCDYTGWD